MKSLSPRAEGTHLLEVITKFNDGGRLKHSLLVDNKLAMLQRVNVTLDKKEIGATLDG